MQQIQIQPVNTACQQSSFSGFITNRFLFFSYKAPETKQFRVPATLFLQSEGKKKRISEWNITCVQLFNTMLHSSHVRKGACLRLLKIGNTSPWVYYFFPCQNRFKSDEMATWPRMENGVNFKIFHLKPISFNWQLFVYLFFISWVKLKAASLSFCSNAELCQSKRKREKGSPRLCHLIKSNV